MSVNLELPTEAGLKELAPNKSRKNILTPMRQIQLGMAESMEKLGMKGGNRSAYWHTSKRLGRHMDDALTKKDYSLLKKDRGQLEFVGGEYEKADRMQVSILPKQKTDFQKKNTNILPEGTGQRRCTLLWNKAETNRGLFRRVRVHR